MRAENGREPTEKRDRPQEHECGRRVMAISEHHHGQCGDDHDSVAYLFESGGHDPSASLTETFGGRRAQQQDCDANRATGDEEHGEERHGLRIVMVRLRLDCPCDAVATVARCLTPQSP